MTLKNLSAPVTEGYLFLFFDFNCIETKKKFIFYQILISVL